MNKSKEQRDGSLMFSGKNGFNYVYMVLSESRDPYNNTITDKTSVVNSFGHRDTTDACILDIPFNKLKPNTTYKCQTSVHNDTLTIHLE